MTVGHQGMTEQNPHIDEQEILAADLKALKFDRDIAFIQEDNVELFLEVNKFFVPYLPEEERGRFWRVNG